MDNFSTIIRYHDREGNRTEKVSWAKDVQKRPCEEVQEFDWSEAARKEKILDKWRWRGEVEWRLKTTAQMLGRGQTAPGQLVDGDDAYVSEEELGWGSPERVEEDEVGYESDSSGQSVLTHIRTPPHIMVEEEEDGPHTTAETERLVNKIPTPPPSLAPLKTFEIRSDSAVSEAGGRRQEGSEVAAKVNCRDLFRSNVRRLRLC